MKRFFTLLSIGMMAAAIPSSSFAITPELYDIYADREDLQSAFEAEMYQAIPGTAAGFLIDLEDWARQYGWQAYPELASYAPSTLPASYDDAGSAPEVSAQSYVVIDDITGTILAAYNADEQRPIASITKLATTKTALDLGLDGGGIGSVEDIDDVGGAKLWVYGGTVFPIVDLLKATLVASANNAANAVARLTGYASETFIGHMNEFAASLNLGRTRFVDPTGIEVENVSTAREVAAFAQAVFENENIRRMTGTSRIHIEAINDDDYVRDISSTNWLLYDSAYDDVYVTAGKTGYLPEAGWNLVVRMHPMGDTQDKSVLIVILGSENRRASADDAAQLARWVWDGFDWSR